MKGRSKLRASLCIVGTFRIRALRLDRDEKGSVLEQYYMIGLAFAPTPWRLLCASGADARRMRGSSETIMEAETRNAPSAAPK
jgi:hypothetical protein